MNLRGVNEHMWLICQRRAWGKESMRNALKDRFLEFAEVPQLRSQLKDVWKEGGFGAPPISIRFADKRVASIENWSLDKKGKAAKLHHFRMHDAQGMKMGEPLLRGFANALKSEHSVDTIYIWETHQHVHGYTRLFERLGAEKTRIVSGGYQEWRWCI